MAHIAMSDGYHSTLTPGADRVLHEAFARGRMTYGRLEPTETQYRAHVHAVLGAYATRDLSLETLVTSAPSLSDVYLALACVQGDARAVALLSKRFMTRTLKALRKRLGATPNDEGFCEELPSLMLYADGREEHCPMAS